MDQQAYCSQCFASFNQTAHLQEVSPDKPICLSCFKKNNISSYFHGTEEGIEEAPQMMEAEERVIEKKDEIFKDYNKKGLLDIVSRNEDYQSCNSCRTKKQNPDAEIGAFARTSLKSPEKKGRARTRHHAFRI